MQIRLPQGFDRSMNLYRSAEGLLLLHFHLRLTLTFRPVSRSLRTTEHGLHSGRQQLLAAASMTAGESKSLS
jgi:hypothetical protein